jgi:3-oxoadipate enol-lactonase
VAPASGVRLHRWESGSRDRALLCIHETGSGAGIWHPLAAAVGGRGRVIAYDRRGWGRSETPEGYRRTTVPEQSEDAVAVLAETEATAAVVVGAGLGAVVALDLMRRRPELTAGGLLIEPPVLAFVPEATAGVSEDAREIRDAVAAGGPPAVLDLFLSGRLTTLGAGAARIPPEIAAEQRERPLTMFAELGAVSAWSLPLDELARISAPSRIVLASSTPPLLRRIAAELESRVPAARIHELEVDGLPHYAGASELAELALELG